MATIQHDKWYFRNVEPVYEVSEATLKPPKRVMSKSEFTQWLDSKFGTQIIAIVRNTATLFDSRDSFLLTALQDPRNVPF